jgi:ABC-type Fe3+ transport system substrate-binding protein
VGGEPYWDRDGRWVGACLSAFGICYNIDVLHRLGAAEHPPLRWEHLQNSRYFHELALANPTQSGSINKAFEMLIQQQILEEVRSREKSAGGAKLSANDEPAAVQAGWAKAMQMLMKIGANARYFSDASTKIVLDVAAGEAAAGMTIDFYGRFESETVNPSRSTGPASPASTTPPPDTKSRLIYTNAERGTSFGADPVGLLRGAPHRELARVFMDWIISPEGQKLWNWRVGTEGGPERYALRRPPILPSLYAPEFRQFRSDPEINPYDPNVRFDYHDKWTGKYFRPIAFIVRVMCIDPHDELARAWKALIDHDFPPEATTAFTDVSAVDYAAAGGRIRDSLTAGKIQEVRLAKELADHFREQYARAEALARQGK